MPHQSCGICKPQVMEITKLSLTQREKRRMPQQHCATLSSQRVARTQNLVVLGCNSRADLGRRHADTHGRHLVVRGRLAGDHDKPG